MKLVRKTSPYLRRKADVSRMMLDVLIALTPIVIFSLYYFGLGALKVILTSVITMVICEALFVALVNIPEKKENERSFIRLFSKENLRIMFKNYRKTNLLSSLVSAIIYAMIMPAGCSIFVLVIGALAGIVLGKLVFGGLGSNIFNPAAVGRIFVMACGFPIVATNVDATTGATPLQDLKNVIDGVSTQYSSINDFLSNTNYSLSELFLGTVPGAIGEVSCLLILIGAIYLFVRRSADFRATLACLGGFIFVNFFAALALNANIVQFILFNLLAGGILFAAVFMVTDPITSPVTGRGRIVYGMLVGIIASFIRLFGAYPEGAAFAILIMNMLVPVIDYYRWSNTKYTPKYFAFVAICLALTATLVFVGL